MTQNNNKSEDEWHHLVCGAGVAPAPRRPVRGAHGSVPRGAFTGCVKQALTMDEAVHAAKSAPPFNSPTPSRGGRDLALGREITDKAGVSFWSTVGSIEILHVRWAGLTGSFSRCSCHNRRCRALDLSPGDTRRDSVGEADVARAALSSAAFSTKQSSCLLQHLPFLLALHRCRH